MPASATRTRWPVFMDLALRVNAAQSGRFADALAGKTVLVNLSGRGDKDVAQVARLMGADLSGTGADGPEAG